MDAMRDTARELVAPGKGILAADESSGTIKNGSIRSVSNRPRRTVVDTGSSCSRRPGSATTSPG